MLYATLAPESIRAIAPYQPGKPISELAREMDLDEASIVKLASNENPLGMGSQAQAALQAAVADLARYPDGNGFALKHALASRFKVAPQQIILGNGSNDVLELVARTFLGPGDEAIYSEFAFAVYPLVTQVTGATGVEVAAKAWGHDLAAMRAAITEKTKIIFIANPNNPTGTLLPADELHQFIASVPKEVLVVLDEAYTEYLAEGEGGDSVAWTREFQNLIVSRTFSKAYGLAGLRVGFAISNSEVADLVNRVRQPFNVNSLAQAAAVAALQDEAFLQESRRVNDEGMQQITAALTEMGLSFIPSRANFVTFHCDHAAQINDYLLHHGIIVRPLAGYRMPNSLRVSIGLAKENARFITVLREALQHYAG